MNVDEAMKIADSSDKAAEWYDGSLIEAVGVLRKEVERLRGELSAEGTAGELILQDNRDLRIENKRLAAEVQRLDIAGIHSCHDDCQKLPCVQRREIERLRAEVESVIRLGPHPAEQVQMPLATFVRSRFVLRWDYDLLVEKLEKAQTELAAAKAASVCPVITLDCYTVNHEIHVACRSLQDCHKLSLWLRDRMKERNEG